MLKESRYVSLDIDQNWDVERIERTRWTLVRKREDACEAIAAMVGQIARAEAAHIADGTPICPKWRAAVGTALRAMRRDKNLLETDIVRLKNLKADKTGADKTSLLWEALKSVLSAAQVSNVRAEYDRLRNSV